IPIPLAVEFRTQVGGFDVLGFIRPVGRIAWVVGGHSWLECRGGQKPSSQYERGTKGIETLGFEQAALFRRTTFGRHNLMNPLDPQPTALAVDGRFEGNSTGSIAVDERRVVAVAERAPFVLIENFAPESRPRLAILVAFGEVYYERVDVLGEREHVVGIGLAVGHAHFDGAVVGVWP